MARLRGEAVKISTNVAAQTSPFISTGKLMDRAVHYQRLGLCSLLTNLRFQQSSCLSEARVPAAHT
jgi:hypothetical protein